MGSRGVGTGDLGRLWRNNAAERWGQVEAVELVQVCDSRDLKRG